MVLCIKINDMKNFIILILVFLTITVNAQKKDKYIRATQSITTDSLLVINIDTFLIYNSTDGQMLRRVSGKWINQDFTGIGTDSLTFTPSTGQLNDYRGGSNYRSTLLRWNNFSLNYGGDRTISVVSAPSGTPADDLIIKAGDNYMGSGGGDLYLTGGGTNTTFGNVYLGGSGIIQVRDSIQMNNNRIAGLLPATTDTEPVTLGQLNGLTQNVFSIALPYNTTVQGRINGAVEGVDYPAGWNLVAADNQIDIVVTHGTGRRVANVNVFTVSGTKEQLLRPFAGAYSGYETGTANVLTINSLATTPLPLKIYILFE